CGAAPGVGKKGVKCPAVRELGSVREEFISERTGGWESPPGVSEEYGGAETRRERFRIEERDVAKTGPQGAVSREPTVSAKPNPTYARPEAEEYGGAETRRERPASSEFPTAGGGEEHAA